MTEAAGLEQLWDLTHIRDLKARYSVYLDTKRWDHWRLLFTEDVRVEGTNQAKDATRDTFVDGVRDSLTRVQTAHQVHEPVTELGAGGTAHGVRPMFDDLRFPEGHLWLEGLPRRIGYGYHAEECSKQDGAWRIPFMRLARLFVWRQDDGVAITGWIPSAGAERLAAGRNALDGRQR